MLDINILTYLLNLLVEEFCVFGFLIITIHNFSNLLIFTGFLNELVHLINLLAPC